MYGRGQTMGDPLFGIKGQALAIHAMLCDDEPSWAPWDDEYRCYKVEIESRPMYNGRERGICLLVRRSLSEMDTLHLFFSERRSSDGIMLLSWVAPHPYNVPDFPWNMKDEAGNDWPFVDEGFSYGEIGKVVNRIQEKCKEFYRQMAAEDERQKNLDVEKAKIHANNVARREARIVEAHDPQPHTRGPHDPRN